LTLASLVCAAPAVAAPPSSARPAVTQGAVFLVGGELHVGDGQVIRDCVVEIVDGRFGRIRQGSRVPLPAGARTIDVAGKVLTPGLIAADSSLGLVEIDLEPSTRDDGVEAAGPVRAAHDAALAVHEDSSLIQVQAIEGVTTAAVAPSGGLLSGQVAWIDLLHGDPELVARARVAIDGSLGQAYGGSRSATIAKLTEVLEDARLYPGRRAAYERGDSRALAAHHLDLEALQPLLRGQAVLTLSANRASDIRAALELARRFGIKIAIVGGAEAWKVADRLAAAKVPVILQPSHNLPGSLDSLGARLDGAALLERAGVEVVIATLGEAHNLRNITQEAGLAVAHGLPWEQALSAVTRNVARAYGLERDYGTVATGKVANLVVWSGDPFELSTAAEQVFIRGRPIPMVSRQTLLRERYRDLARSPR
ncbi:MAG: amidohydrolase family protein, partial [Myxococcales bacterium]|nr:amidohydrolase family protein [Myxococcales bacterium]